MRRSLLSIALLLSLTTPVASSQSPETFAQCVAKNGGVMYSAWWCPYCFAQLHEFDPTFTRRGMQDPERMKSFPFVIDCGGVEPGTLRRGCAPEHARGVPMWTFTKHPIDPKEYDGGGMDLLEIAARTGCAAPASALRK